MLLKISGIKLYLQNLLSHKTIIFYVLLLSFIIYLPSVKIGFVLDDIWHRISNVTYPGLSKEDYKIFNMHGPMRAYTLLDGSIERTRLMINKGILPWWTNTDTKINFWRPISAILLEFDYAFFPNNPGIMHLHSLCWFLLLLILVGLLFFKIFGNELYAGLSVLIFAFNGTHFLSIYWLANRHIIVSAVFGVGAILLFLKWIDNRKIVMFIFSLGLFCLGVLSSEIGIAAFAFILSYSIFLDNDSVINKIRYLLPFILIILIWHIIYVMLGYGVSTNDLYVYPLEYPFRFLIEVLMRFPFLVIGILGYPPADFYLLLSPELVPVFSVFFWSLIISVGYFTHKFWFRNKVSLFWLFSSILVLIPLCAVIPANRDLGFAAVGAVGFIIMVLKNVLVGIKVTGISKIITTIFLIYLGLTEIVLFPIKYYMDFNIVKILEMNQFTNFSDDTNISDKDIIIADAFGSYIISYWLPNYFLNTDNLPKHLRILSPGFTFVEFRRIDLYTLSVRPKDGFFKPPGRGNNFVTLFNNNYISASNLLLRMERLIQDETESFKINQVLRLPNVLVKIITLTKDGRPLEVEYRFNHPLEDEKYKWITWDIKLFKYEIFILPKIGETIRIDNQNFLLPE